MREIAMTDDSKQAIPLRRQMLALTQQFVLLEIFDSALKAAKDGDKDKFLTTLKALNDCESVQSKNPSEITAILLSKVALLAELEGGSCDEQRIGS